MSEDVKDNQGKFKKNQEHIGTRNLKLFGRDKPAIPGPGRPRLPEGVKERRAFLRRKLEETSVKAIEVVSEILNDPDTEPKDLLRASEISLAHSLPRQEEVDLHDERPLSNIPAEQLEEKLAELNASRNGNHSGTGDKA